MVSNSVVVPCAVLGAIVFCMLAFICWWFPRTWAKGQALDKREYLENAERRRQRDLELATSETIIGEDTDVGENQTEAHTRGQERTSAGDSTGTRTVRAQTGENAAAGAISRGG